MQNTKLARRSLFFRMSTYFFMDSIANTPSKAKYAVQMLFAHEISNVLDNQGMHSMSMAQADSTFAEVYMRITIVGSIYNDTLAAKRYSNSYMTK